MAKKETHSSTPTLLNTTNSALRNWPLAWIVLAVGLLITSAGTLYMKSSVENVATLEFTSNCNQIAIKITDRVDEHARILLSGVALFNASDIVTREKWRIFNKAQKVQKQLPGIQGIGFSLLIPRSELTQHMQKMRGEGFPQYKLRPDGDREIYSSIIYLEPFSGRNLRAFGYDMLSEPVRRSAMERARDTNTAALSGKVVLVQETSTDVQAGTLMYVPVYRKGMPIVTIEQRRAAIYGWVYSPYRMNDLMQGIIGTRNLEKEKQLHIQVFDGAQPSPESLLYDSLSRDKKSPGQISNQSPDRFTRQIPIDFNGQRWTLSFGQTSGGFFAVEYTSIWLTLVGGILITLLLFALIRTLLSTRAQAQHIAENLTIDLREREEKIILLLNSTAEAIYGLDMNGNCTFCNNACIRLLGYKHPEELLGKNMHWQIHAKYQDGRHFPVEECRIFQAFNKGEGTHVDDEVLWRSDGTSFPSEYWSYPQRSGGEVIGAVVTFLDITLRRQAEETLQKAYANLETKVQERTFELKKINDQLLNDITERKQIVESLRESENRYKSLVENSFSCIYVIQDGCFLFANNNAIKFTGYEPEDIIGKPSDSFVHPDDRGIIREKAKKMISGEDISPYEFRIVSKTGELRWLMETVSSIIFNGRRAILGNCIDITERRQREVQELHSQKLESVGQLAAGIAHEINTPIQFVGDNISFMKDAFQDILSLTNILHALKSDDLSNSAVAGNLLSLIHKKEMEIDLDFLSKEIPQAIEQSLEGLQRVVKIIMAMREFSHPGGENKTDLDINKAIESTITLSRNEWKYSADLTTTLAPDLPIVQGYPADFNQVILNIIINAAQALQGKAGKGNSEKGRIEISTRQDGNEVEICIRDTGMGILPVAQSRVFDPFFTTKEVGKGTGQGLTIAHNIIVQKHGGKIFFETKPGEGTAFYIRLQLIQ